MEAIKSEVSEMVQNKYRKEKYRNTSKNEKAANCGRGFHFNSKIYLKSQNITIWIIEYNRRNCTLFYRQTGGVKNDKS